MVPIYDTRDPKKKTDVDIRSYIFQPPRYNSTLHSARQVILQLLQIRIADKNNHSFTTLQPS